MITAEQVKVYIETALPCEHVVVEGEDGRHFQACIVSGQFQGKSMVQQHQLVYKSLGERMIRRFTRFRSRHLRLSNGRIKSN